MNILTFTVEKLKDPTGILVGDRYEFILSIEVDEEDELFSENGLQVKVILAVTDEETRIAQYQLFEANTNKYFDFALEDDELAEILTFCKGHIEE